MHSVPIIRVLRARFSTSTRVDPTLPDNLTPPLSFALLGAGDRGFVSFGKLCVRCHFFA
jgi:hypothetical protein